RYQPGANVPLNSYVEAEDLLAPNMGKRLSAVRDAVGYLRVATALRPRSPGAWLNLGFALKGGGQFAAAVEAYQRAIDVNPDYAMAHCNMAETLLFMGKVEEAERACRRALALQPKMHLAIRHLGKVHMRKGKVQEALRLFQQAIDADPGSPG